MGFSNIIIMKNYQLNTYEVNLSVKKEVYYQYIYKKNFSRLLFCNTMS